MVLTFAHGVGRSGSSQVTPGPIDVWMLDAPAQGWERVIFEQTLHPDGDHDVQLADGNCVVEKFNTELPTNRAGHTAVSTGSQALVCGGYSAKTASGTQFVGNGKGLECWWFTPTPHPRFDKLKSKAATQPPVRWGHSAAVDPKLGHVLVFGGMTAGHQALDDCWFLQLDDSVDPAEVYEWFSCSPPGQRALRPEPRYGSGAVFHGASDSFYVFGGFAWTGASFEPMNDMWVLHDYANISSVEWIIVNSISEQPRARGFHAMWISGFSIYMHGGQVPSGAGKASVTSETWSYDIYTKVWLRYGSSDAAPLARSLSASLVSAKVAVAFGGTGMDSRPIGDCVRFDPSSGWNSITPSGARPPRAAGQSAIYDVEALKMVVSFGIAQGPVLLDDQWTLDLAAMAWSRTAALSLHTHVCACVCCTHMCVLCVCLYPSPLPSSWLSPSCVHASVLPPPQEYH